MQVKTPKGDSLELAGKKAYDSEPVSAEIDD